MTWWLWTIAETWRITRRSPEPHVRVNLRAKLLELERAEARCDRERQELIWRQIYGLEKEPA
jgi:hypothetical protein